MDNTNKINDISKEKQLKYSQERTKAILLDSSNQNTGNTSTNNSKKFNEPIKTQRNLIQSSSPTKVSECDIPASIVATVAATVTEVMGGSRDDGLLTPNRSNLLDFNVNPSNNCNIHTIPIKSSTSLQNIIAENLINQDYNNKDTAGDSQHTIEVDSGEYTCNIKTDYISECKNRHIFLCNNSDEYEQELSILNNLNIDTTSELTFTDSYNSCSRRNSSRSGGGNILNLNNTKYLRESPIRYVDCDDNSIMGSDLSTSAASAKLTSGNTSLSGESSISGGFGSSLDAPPPPLTRLQNFLFNKSNDSTKSFEIGTSSSNNGQSSNPLSPKLIERNINSNTANFTNNDMTTTIRNDNFVTSAIDESYYYQTTSQNNPFLPDIIAKKNNDNEETNKYINLNQNIHHNHNDQDECINECSDSHENMNYFINSGFSPISEHEKHFDIVTKVGNEGQELNIIKIEEDINNLHDDHHITECVKSVPSRKSKFFSLISPTSESNDNKNVINHQKLLKKKCSPQSSIKRSFNPFLRYNHQEQLNQQEQQSDLNAKREEFLKATMKICLVVSPPSSKLQLKSKSLTHLDVLDSMVACHRAESPKNGSEQMDISLHQTGIIDKQLPQPILPTVSSSGSGTSTCIDQPSQYYTHNTHHHYQSISSAATTTTNSCNKICCIGQQTSIGSIVVGSISPPLRSDNEFRKFATNTSSGALAATLNAASIHPVGLSTTNVQQLQSQLNLSQYKNQQQSQQQHGSFKNKSSFINRKKPILTRSTVSSSEYFSVSFCTEIGYDVEEFIPITKGVTLSEALSSALKMRNLNFSQIIISDNNLQNFCESETPPYSVALDENTDIERLAGKHLIATEKDDFYINKKSESLQKAASFGSKVRPPRLLSSASTEETTSESEQKIIPGKQLKQRWSGLFGIKNPQQTQLCELLNRYAKLGVPQKLSSVNFDHPEFDLAFEYLDKMHSSWQEFVLHDKMPENEIKIQSAIWELVTTEVDYIHALQTVTDLFLACLEAIQKERILIDVDQMKLFSNIRDICEANLKFWIHYLYPMVANSIKTQNPLCINYFQSGFLTFATNFGSYKKYCAEQSTCQFYCKELNQNNSVFTSYLAWCESQKMCNRLRLADILVRPMQRLTKYSLLLTAIRKHICDENDADNIDSMIHSVENFVYSVNTHLTTRQENERLKGIMARIEAYDVVDASNEQLEKLAKQYNQMFDLCAPMNGCSPTQCRHLFMEGDLKLKDNISKTDVHCFLLTDILLICKTIAKKGQGILKVIRQPYMTDRLIVKHKENSLYCVYLNEFQVGVAAFILQCTEAKNWLDGITKAKHIYSRLKQGSNWDIYNNYRLASIGGNSSYDNANNMLGVKKSPLNSSFGSRVSSLNNSHSGSIELNDSRNISVDFEKANSLSSDEGSLMSNQISQNQKTLLATSPHQQKAITSNTLKIHPVNNLGQSLPNLNIHHSQASNNTLLVPDHISSISGNLLLSPCHRGISYPPPSPTRATLRRGMAFSATIKNPPLVKTRNITSQNSINWHQNISSQSSITPPTSPNQQLPPKLAASNSVVTSHSGSVSPKMLMNQQSDV